MTAWVPVLVALGAGLGAGARYLAALHLDGHWPLGTLTANVLGSAAAGGAVAAIEDGPHLTALVVVGFAGGLTTLSGLAVQVHTLGLRRGTAYGAVTLALATLACVAAYTVV